MKNAFDSIRIDLDSVTMSENALRTCYELVTDLLNREFLCQNFEPFKTLAPNSRLTQELQQVTTDYKIQLRTSRTDYVSATNPNLYQFVAIRGSSGRSVIPPLTNKSLKRIIMKPGSRQKHFVVAYGDNNNNRAFR